MISLPKTSDYPLLFPLSPTNMPELATVMYVFIFETLLLLPLILGIRSYKIFGRSTDGKTSPPLKRFRARIVGAT